MARTNKRLAVRSPLRAFFTKRNAVVLIVAPLALWLILVKSAGNLYASKRPELALTFDPQNHLALANIASSSIVAADQELQFSVASDFALRALSIAPRDSESLAVLGFAADEGEFDTDGLYLISKAQKYSKRNLLSQIYLIDHSLQQGNLRLALEHYNQALSTHPSSQPRLLPRLYQALVLPEVRQELIGLLRQDPAWKRDFWLGLTDLRPVPQSAIELILENEGNKKALIPGIGQRLIRGLLSERRFEEARQIANLEGAKDRVITGSQSLAEFYSEDPLPGIDWRYESSGAHNSSPVQRGLLLSIRGSQELAFANRIAALPPGQAFRILGTVESAFGTGAVNIIFRCANEQAPTAIAEAEVNETGTATLDSDVFVVPAGCNWQWLQISGEGESGRTSELLLTDLAITGQGE